VKAWVRRFVKRLTLHGSHRCGDRPVQEKLEHGIDFPIGSGKYSLDATIVPVANPAIESP
jgi:hypothetical protein